MFLHTQLLRLYADSSLFYIIQLLQPFNRQGLKIKTSEVKNKIFSPKKKNQVFRQQQEPLQSLCSYFRICSIPLSNKRHPLAAHQRQAIKPNGAITGNKFSELSIYEMLHIQSLPMQLFKFLLTTLPFSLYSQQSKVQRLSHD